MSVGDTCYYSVQHQTINEWEVGLATYSSANTLTRTTIYSSSNAGSAVNFSAGTKDVFITMAASRTPQLDASGNVTPATGTYTRTTITATAGQTSFTASYTVNYVQVYVNGILLNSADYTATTGTTVVLASAAAAGDIVDVVAINIGTFTGGVTITGTPTNGQIATWTGSTSIQGGASPATAGNVLFTSDGTNWSSTAKIVQPASVSPSGTAAASFTGLPSWVKRVVLQFSALTSATAGATMVVQLGTGATPTYTTSGYTGALGLTFNGTASAASALSSGFTINTGYAANAAIYGTVTLTNLTGNTWIGNMNFGRTGTLMSGGGGGIIALGATLTAVQILSSANYNGGTVSILYE
jgi:hypothetical protein